MKDEAIKILVSDIVLDEPIHIQAFVNPELSESYRSRYRILDGTN